MIPGMNRAAPVSSRSLPAASAKRAAPELRFKPVRSPRAFEEIAGQIRERMAGGQLKVGSKLPAERELAEQFSVSRNTVREALRSLEHAGLIRQHKGATGGSFVSDGSHEAVGTGLLDMYNLGTINPEQLTQARIWLESLIVREACRRATPADIAALEANIKAAADARRQSDFAGRSRIHLDFHRMLATMTGNPVMITVMNGVLEVLRHFIERIGEYDNAFVLPSRRRFMKHMAAGDAEAAVAEMEANLKRLQASYLSHLPAEERAED